MAVVHYNGRSTSLFPFLFIVHRGECWSRVRERLRRKMAVPKRIFDAWKFRYRSHPGIDSNLLDPLAVLYDGVHRDCTINITQCTSPVKCCNYQALVVAEYARAARSVQRVWPLVPTYVHEHLSNYVTIDADVCQFLSFAQRMRIVNYVRRRPIVATSLAMLLRHVLVDE